MSYLNKLLSFSKSLTPLCIAALALALTGCDNSENKKSETKTEKYEYEFKEYADLSFTTLKCSTGPQSFSSFEAYCSGLQNDSLNRNCYRTAREQAFIQSNCPGSFASSGSTKPPVVGVGNGSPSHNPGAGVGNNPGDSPVVMPPVSSAMDAKFVLVRPVSSKSSQCKTEYELPLKELSPLGDVAAANNPLIDIKTRIFEEVPGLNAKDLVLEINFNHGPLVSVLGKWSQKIEAPSIDLQHLDFAIQSGKTVRVTLSPKCRVKNNPMTISDGDVTLISRMSDMKRPSIDVNPELSFEVLEYKKESNKCDVIRSFSIDEIKQSIIKDGADPIAVNTADIKAKYESSVSTSEQRILISFLDQTQMDPNFALKRYEIITLAPHDIDLMKDLKSNHVVRLSLNNECMSSIHGQVHFGLFKSKD